MEGVTKLDLSRTDFCGSSVSGKNIPGEIHVDKKGYFHGTIFEGSNPLKVFGLFEYAGDQHDPQELLSMSFIQQPQRASDPSVIYSLQKVRHFSAIRDISDFAGDFVGRKYSAPLKQMIDSAREFRDLIGTLDLTDQHHDLARLTLRV